MIEAYRREIALIGEENFARLRAAHVYVFGIGGVGSFAAEALVRAGVGRLTFVDGDAVAESNLNRQLVALRSTLGKNKARVMAERARDIDPSCRAEAVEEFYNEATAEQFRFAGAACVADCIDDVSAKVRLLAAVRGAGVPAVSAMGAGNKLCGNAFRIAPIERTRECPLAKIVRRELRQRGVSGVLAVYSEEQPRIPMGMEGERRIGSVSFVPSAAGLLVAEAVVKTIIGQG